MKKNLLLFATTILFVVNAMAQAQDAEGCKDHPMFNRMPDFLIGQCTENFASLDVVTGKDSKIQASLI